MTGITRRHLLAGAMAGGAALATMTAGRTQTAARGDAPARGPVPPAPDPDAHCAGPLPGDAPARGPHTPAPGDALSPAAAPTRPARLRRGDRVALVAPASATYDDDTRLLAVESLEALGLQVTVGEHAMSRYGYLAGRDRDRAADINAAFADDRIQGVVALRGGWGALRALPYIDFETIAANPKVMLGYSDITTLLLALLARSNLVGFHGPNGTSAWTDFTAREMQRVVFEGDTPLMRNPRVRDGTLAVRRNRTWPIVPGRARGRLVGGNLTLFAALAGTPYFPDATGAIVFLEESEEYIYRCDRMLTQLALAGVFEKAAGVVLGGFTDCDPSPNGYGRFSLNDVFQHHFAPLGKPAFSGAMFGHVDRKRTLPLGVEAEIDAEAGTIELLEPAVI